MNFWESFFLSELISQLPLMIKVGVATILGCIIGLERESAGRSAGLRTHMLVGGAACLLALLGIEIILYTEETVQDNISADPTRILHALIVGISFIGGGTILKDESKHTVKNLTTATSILMTAGAGVSIAVEKYYLAAMLVLLTLSVNSLIYWMKKKWLE